VIVSINTDDPAYQGTNLETEYAITAQTYGWDAMVCREIARNSVVASFCPEDVRDRMLGEIDVWSPDST